MKKVYCLLCCCLLFSCTSVFYQPDRQVYATPESMGVSYESFFFPSQDGTRLHAWHLKRKNERQKSSGLILFFHGNAENLTSHFASLAFLTAYGFDVMIFDYRGYGMSHGEPTPELVHLDGLSALEEGLQLHRKLGSKSFIVYGQSLGGLVGLRALMDFAKLSEVDLVVADSTFSSYQELGFAKLTSFWPFWPLGPLAYVLLSDDMSLTPFLHPGLSEKRHAPLLVIHGDRDSIVPWRFGREIYEKYPGAKWMWTIPQGDHIDVFWGHQGSYREKFVRFLQQIPDFWVRP